MKETSNLALEPVSDRDHLQFLGLFLLSNDLFH